jgi:hypothetical protein
VNVAAAPPATPSAPDTRGQKQNPVYADIHDPSSESLAFVTKLLVAVTALLARATLGVAGFGARQAYLAHAQVRLAAEQVALARQEFVAANRPQITLREGYAITNADGPVVVRYTLANLGGTTARITRSLFCVDKSPLSHIRTQVALGPQGNVPGMVGEIKAGAHADSKYEPGVVWPSGFRGSCAKDDPMKKERQFSAGPDGWVTNFYGRVAYEDDEGTERQMAFYRILEFGTCRFVPYGDPQLEYSDTNP